MEHSVQCVVCGSGNVENEKLCLDCKSDDINIDDIPSYSEVMDEIYADFEEKNKPTYEFLAENEDEEFVEKLLEFANEVSEMANLGEHEQKIIDDNGFNWKNDDEYPHSDIVQCAFNQTVNGGYLGDEYSGYAYVKLPRSGKVFQFEYSM